LIKCVHF